MKTPTIGDWAQLAAYIDGEGTIVINVYKKIYTQLVVRVANTDERLPRWCAERFTGKVFKGKAPKSDRNFFTWVVQSRKAEAVLRGCLEHFILKREQAEVALEYRKTFRRRNGKTYGQRVTPEEATARLAARKELQRLKRELPLIHAPMDTDLIQ